MALKTLSHTFEVSKVPYTSLTDVLENVRKRKERVVFSGKTLPDNINMAYLQVSEVNSDKNMFLSDHSTFFAPNIVQNTDPVKFTGTSYVTEVSQFFLTDKFTSASPSLAETPLFFKHIISSSRYVAGTDKIVSLEILDHEFRAIPNVSQLLVQDDVHDGSTVGVVYNNFENVLDEAKGIVNIFYVKYSVRSGANTFSYVELLNNQPVYREATFEDLDSFNTIKPNRKVYVLDEGSSSFTISQLANATYYIVQKLRTRLSLNKPSTKTIDQEWFLTVSNGQFFANEFQGTSIVKYEIAEFLAQDFSPYPPFKTITGEEPDFVSGTLYRTGFRNVFIDPAQGIDFVVELVDEQGDIETTFSFNAGEGIRSVDRLGGFFDLKEKPAPGLTVRANYVYEEKELQIVDVDFNPAFNVASKNEMVAVYVTPQSSPRDRTVFYVRVNKFGQVLYSSQAEYGDDIGVLIRGKGFGVDGLATGSYTYTQFKQDFTVESTLAGPNSGLLILGEAYVGEAVSPDDIVIVDTRVRGGGIKESLLGNVLAENYESAWNWDLGHWDGTPFPGTCTFFVEVPCELLKDAGGTLEREELRTIVSKHTAFGVYPIIKTYGPDPIITSVTIRATEVDLEWIDQGPNVTFNVYRATSATGPYVKLNGSPLSSNTYTATGMTSKHYYWFFITGVENGYECTGSDGRYILELQTR